MNSILDNLKALGKGRLIILSGVLIITVLAVFFGVRAVTKPVYSTLYNGLSPTSASEMVRTLEQGGFQVQISSDSSVVMVPQGDIARARMILAENGLPNDGAPGWELFDQGGSLGMNTFLQKVNSRRALEGELARSIQTIKGIDAARVHLVLPEREAFSRERADPTASVVIRTNLSFSMDKKQALSIRHLVSSAVPGLSPNKVTVTTNSGEVLAAEDVDGVSGEVTLQSVRSSLEDRYARAVEKILTARVGSGNARVQVSVDVTTERRVVTEQSFNPNEQVVRSTETSTKSEEDTQQDASDVSVGNNLPENLAGDGAGGPSSKNTREESNEIVNYEIGSTLSETVYEPGDVERISVAVLVNGIFEREDGTVEYKERDPEELELLKELVKTAIGFQDGRGDSVSVRSLRFMDYSMDVGEPIGLSIMQVLTENIMTIIKWIFALLIVVAVLALGLKPTLRAIAPPAPVKDEDEEAVSEDGETPSEAAAKPDQGGSDDAAERPTPDALKSVQEKAQKDEEMISVMSVQGGVRKQRLTHLGDMVDKDQEETLKLIRAWMAPEL
ncbi:flagellar basal-body MS-ring/collar protein FliF [Sulfitobacter sp. R18_1]|uniref:flagellar basal-body MS-ring/collar protein FliF n=1 Tax=Sulfitobacter sp. R18_1 TaxID=2821104 RepID=UPI001ADAD5B5|nr:flagellar M-ring protein FliF [Sulfitobacter sp. R18_1]